MKQLELRRHARRDPQHDRLSPEGRVQAEDVGRTLAGRYAVVFASPAERAAETVAWFLRSARQQLPAHDAIPGLAGEGVEGGTPDGLAEVVRGLLARVPEGERGLAVGHTPLIEKAVLGLTGQEIAPLGECEGVLISQDEDGRLSVLELRLGS